MKKNIYRWKTSEIIRRYIKCLKEIVSTSKKDKDKLLDLMLDKQCIEDMLLFPILKLPNIPKIQNVNRDLLYDKNFIKNDTTIYQQSNIKSFIDVSLNTNFKLTKKLPNNIKDNIICVTSSFLNSINSDLEDELTNAIDNNLLYLNNSKREKSYVGTTYALSDENYYEIFNNSSSNNFLILNHESTHGYINKITNRKFDKDNNIILYREVASLLIELYSNDYAYNNNLINFEEFVSNFNNYFVENVYNDIEIIDMLYTIATDNHFIINKDNINAYIEFKRNENPNYNFDINELTKTPLKRHLIYLYSSIISLGIYYNYKDNAKEGMKVAFDIIKKINKDNEKQLLNFYHIDPLGSINKYIDDNNELIKKMNN